MVAEPTQSELVSGGTHGADVGARGSRIVTKLVAVLALILATFIPQTALAPAASAAGAQMVAFDQEMTRLVNVKRAEAGLPAVQEATGLTQLSVWWSSQLADGATSYNLEHNPNAFQQVLSYGASNRTTWGENVAKWSPISVTAAAIFDAYWNSPGHKANILGAAFRYVGMGSVTGANGMSWNTMTFTDKVDAGQVIVPNIPVSGQLVARDATNGAPLPGVTFQIRNGSCTSTYSTMVTQGNGTFPISAYPGNYCAVPIGAPAGYGLPANAAFTVTPGQAFTVDVALMPAPSSGQLVARSASGAPIAGAVFQVRGSTCATIFSTMTTNASGTFAISAYPGTYCAVPVSVPSGFSLPGNQLFTVTAGQSFSAELTVPSGPTTGQLVAQNVTGGPLPGVTVQIRNSACTSVFSTMATNASGAFPITAYPGSTYCAVPIGVPPGFTLPPAMLFTSGETNGWTASLQVGPSVVSGQLRAVNSATGAVIPGVAVQIRNASCTAVFSTMVTGGGGAFPISANPGRYCAVPVGVPAGYDMPGALVFDTSNTSFTATVSVNPQPQPVTGKLIAVNGAGTPLPGAAIQIRNGSCGATFSTMWTQADGTFPITAYPGTYCAVPVVAPAGYGIPAPKTFTVTQAPTFNVSVTF